MTTEQANLFRKWLERHPAAVAFGVDAGAIRVAFVDIYAAGEWLRGMLP
jgi:hypothetical protein